MSKNSRRMIFYLALICSHHFSVTMLPQSYTKVHCVLLQSCSIQRMACDFTDQFLWGIVQEPSAHSTFAFDVNDAPVFK